MKREQTRYDLIPDLPRWLVRSGVLTEAQARRVLEKARWDLRSPRLPSLGEILLSEGVSEAVLLRALRSLHLLDPNPLELRSLGPGAPPLTRLIALILGTALGASAGALEFRKDGAGLQVRYQIDGVWYDMETIPLPLGAPVLDGLRELTSTGRLALRIDGKPLDLAVDSDAPAFRLRVEPGTA